MEQPRNKPDQSADHQDLQPLARLEQALLQEADAPTAGDERVGYCARALSNVLHHPEFEQLMEKVYTTRPHLRERPRYTMNLALRAVTRQLLYDDATPDFPEGFTSAERYQDAIETVLALRPSVTGRPDYHKQSGFLMDMLSREVQSNIASRAVSVKLAWLLRRINRGQDASGLHMVEFGCSQNQIGNQLAANEPFDDVQVGQLVGPPDQPMFIRDSKQTASINGLLQIPLEGFQATGIDIWDRHDLEVQQWVYSCLRPAELMNKTFMDAYRARIDVDLPTVDFIGADITDPQLLDPTYTPWPRSLHGDNGRLVRSRSNPLPARGSVDIALFSMVLHQLTTEGREVALQHARDITTPDGLIVVNEFATTGLHIVDEWPQWSCRTFLFDKTEPDQGFQEYLRADHGRFRKLQLGNAALRDLKLMEG